MKLRAFITLDITAANFRDAANIETKINEMVRELALKANAESYEVDLRERRNPRTSRNGTLEAGEVDAPEPDMEVSGELPSPRRKRGAASEAA